MARALHEIYNICRLCLCEDEEQLMPALKIIEPTLTEDDIERLTGIRILEEPEHSCYAICADCGNKLKKFAIFRATCINNNERFRQLFDALIQNTNKNEVAIDEDFILDPAQNEADPCETTETIHEINYFDPCIETEYEEDSSDRYEEISCIKVPLEASNDENIILEKLNQKSHGNISSKRTVRRFKRNQKTKETLTITRCPETGSDAKSKSIIKRPLLQKQLCPICGKLVQCMQDHLLSHTKEQKFACSYCPMTCSRKAYLKLHIDAVHLKKIVQKCEICNRGFTHGTSYTAHMRAQHGVGESYECKTCGIKFRHRGGLRGHNNRKHNDESNCQCPICGMQFQDKKGLKDHSRVHSNEKPFACKYCSKRFKSPNAKRTHELTHSGITFQCTLCDKAYRYKTLLNAHMRKFHAGEDSESIEKYRNFAQ